MKKNYLVFLFPLIIFGAFVLSCDGTLPPGISDFMLVSIDDTDYTDSADYDFGIVAAEGSGKTVSMTFINNSAESITVSEVTLSDDESYSIVGPSLPVTAEPGAETETSLTFLPGSSGVFDAVMTVTLEGTTETFTLNLSGTGNYAPEVRFGVNVSDAGDSDANGFYERDGFLDTENYRWPLYTKTGSPDYFLYEHAWDGDVWGIDQTKSNTDPAYYTHDETDTMSPVETGWTDNSNDNSPPTVAVYDIKGTYMEVDLTITAAYLYYDQDGDSENAAAVEYQWYRSTSEDGTYTALSGATSKTYTLADSDAGYYFRVEVTTAASSGFTEDVSVMSSPTVQVPAMQ